MIGWVQVDGRKEIYPVLCWVTVRRDNEAPPLLVVTTTGCMWFRSLVVPLDTEAEVAALLLQGYTMAASTPSYIEKSMPWLRRN